MVGKDKDFMEPKFVVEINSYLDVIQRAYQAGEFPPEPEQLQRKNVQKDMIIGIICALIINIPSGFIPIPVLIIFDSLFFVSSIFIIFYRFIVYTSSIKIIKVRNSKLEKLGKKERYDYLFLMTI